MLPYSFLTKTYFELYREITNCADAKKFYNFLGEYGALAGNMFVRNIISQNMEKYIDKSFIDAEMEDIKRIGHINKTDGEEDPSKMYKIFLGRMINNLYEKFDTPSEVPKRFDKPLDEKCYIFDNPETLSAVSYTHL